MSFFSAQIVKWIHFHQIGMYMMKIFIYRHIYQQCPHASQTMGYNYCSNIQLYLGMLTWSGSTTTCGFSKLFPPHSKNPAKSISKGNFFWLFSSLWLLKNNGMNHDEVQLGLDCPARPSPFICQHYGSFDNMNRETTKLWALLSPIHLLCTRPLYSFDSKNYNKHLLLWLTFCECQSLPKTYF